MSDFDPLDFACPTCHAIPGVPCRNEVGRERVRFHNSRQRRALKRLPRSKKTDALELKQLRLSSLNRQTNAILTQVEAAGLIGVDKNTYARYERGDLPIPIPVIRLARLVLRGEVDVDDT